MNANKTNHFAYSRFVFSRSFVANHGAENLKPIINEMVCESAHIMTDSSTVLNSVTLSAGPKPDQVNHMAKEYVRYGDGMCITTNGVGRFFCNLKRGLNGVYHHVGKHHLHRYLAEFDFRYNAREVYDGTPGYGDSPNWRKASKVTGTHAGRRPRKKEKAVTANHGFKLSAAIKNDSCGVANATRKPPDRIISRGRWLLHA